MEPFTMDGSPTPRKAQLPKDFIKRENSTVPETAHGGCSLGTKRENHIHRPDVLQSTTSNFADQFQAAGDSKANYKKQRIDIPSPLQPLNMDPTDYLSGANTPMEELLAKLSERQHFLVQQHQAGSAHVSSDEAERSSTSPSPQAVHSFGSSLTPASSIPESAEVLRLKKELEMAQSRLARMDQGFPQIKGSQNESEPPTFRGLGIQNYPSPLVMTPDEPSAPLAGSLWSAPPPGGIWNQASSSQHLAPAPFQAFSPAMLDMSFNTAGGSAAPRGPSPASFAQPFQQQPQQVNSYGGMMQREVCYPSRPASAMSNYGPAWSSFGRGSDHNSVATPLTPLSFGPPQHPFPGQHASQFNAAPGGAAFMSKSADSRLSPTAIEFNVPANNSLGGYTPWNMQSQQESQQSYMSNTEPMNYRRLLDRNMSCNWKYIVDKIVCANDQQASIFLQQKLKVGTAEQKFEIVQAIIEQAYCLMTNRFGNFLVQRCFEHGTPEQIIAIARTIRGSTLNLSMDAFGCHVVQKAFDSVPEEYKAIMVHELLCRIPETVIHRYACHVWQKLFELRWTGSPPQIMKYVNEALRGMWHEVALGETGSLVVQNIFENCLEEDKRPCINEVLASIDVVAHGQFGNWCIQHICEHGSIPDRTRATDHVLRFATEYSMDQFASKVVEKCLKISGPDFLDRYLDRVCEARADRPRMPLIDIAGDQFGNYLIQFILTNADPPRREVVAAHIRKHMVSLRGSKYGSRVAMLCCNPAFATRPGPPTAMPMGRGSGGPNGWSERPAYSDRPSYGGPRGSGYSGGY